MIVTVMRVRKMGVAVGQWLMLVRVAVAGVRVACLLRTVMQILV